MQMIGKGLLTQNTSHLLRIKHGNLLNCLAIIKQLGVSGYLKSNMTVKVE